MNNGGKILARSTRVPTPHVCISYGIRANLRRMRLASLTTVVLASLIATESARAQEITTAGQPAQLDIRAAGDRSLRVTLKPRDYSATFPFSPGVAETKTYPAPAVSLRTLAAPVKRKVGNLNVEVR